MEHPSRTRRAIAIFRRLLWLLFVGVLGFAGGAFTLFVIVLRGGPAHEVWHDVELGEEFTAARTAEVRTLDDYLALEERLFAELEREVYARVGVGPEFSFVRYSSGSRSDPGLGEVDWNRSFERFPDRAIGGALLLHGLSDSPYSMRATAEVLHAKGYHVLGLRLPGHGTVPSALRHTTVDDMAAAVRIGMRGLRQRIGDLPIHVVGYSTGAALAIRHSLDVLDGDAEIMPRSLVLISPAVGLTPAAAFASWLELLSEVPGLEKAAWTELLPEYDPYKYGSFPINAGKLVYQLTSSNAARIAARSGDSPLEGFPPTLVFLSTVDATVSTEAVVDNLLEHLEPGRHELVLFDLNRSAATKSLLVEDPGPLTERMIEDEVLPFALTLITNADPETAAVVARRKDARSGDAVTAELGMEWPRGVFSLSHVALPFPDDDPIYGRDRPEGGARIHLGHPSVVGERGLLRVPAATLLRMRHNPFFDVLAERIPAWTKATDGD